ncbi:MAG: hypothetical protein CMJ40_07175 [Phycisphaerae bacterium]|nr:hypothetical protein [Phycisphaerae bacterium]|tara:strand:+ start:612 stop:962 length:351 start_codon:yes stop_codon:yes gene_type:complete
MLPLKLIMKTEGDHERVFSMHHEEMTIGRDLSCDLRIPLPQVSSRHCRISEQGENRILENLDRSVATHVNGEKIERTILQDDDVVQIGPVVFHVSIGDGPDGRTFEIRREDDGPSV